MQYDTLILVFANETCSSHRELRKDTSIKIKGAQIKQLI